MKNHCSTAAKPKCECSVELTRISTTLQMIGCYLTALGIIDANTPLSCWATRLLKFVEKGDVEYTSWQTIYNYLSDPSKFSGVSPIVVTSALNKITTSIDPNALANFIYDYGLFTGPDVSYAGGKFVFNSDAIKEILPGAGITATKSGSTVTIGAIPTDLSNYFNKTEINGMFGNYYTKTEIDGLIPSVPSVSDATIEFADPGGITINSFTLNQSANKRITLNNLSLSQVQAIMPTVNNPTITFMQGGSNKGSITLNQATNLTITFDVPSAPDLSNYYTKSEVDGLIPAVNNPTISFTQGGASKGSITLNQSAPLTIALDAAPTLSTTTTIWEPVSASSHAVVQSNYGGRWCRYTVIGSIVFFSAEIRISTYSSTAGGGIVEHVKVSGLPGLTYNGPDYAASGMATTSVSAILPIRSNIQVAYNAPPQLMLSFDFVANINTIFYVTGWYEIIPGSI